MAKDLAGTNVAAQKAATFYTPTWLVDVVRDHPETGESIFRVASWSGPYTIGGNTYKDLLDRDSGLSDIRMYIEPGGGLAIVSDVTLVLSNPTDFPSNRRLSDMLDDFYLENDEVRISLVFQTGSEVAGDILRMFTGLIKDARINTREFQISAKDGKRQTLRSVPQEFLDRVEFLNAPLNVQDRPYPVAFGNLNVEPWATSGNPPNLASCMMLDIFDNQYTAGFLCKTHGQPYVFYRSARYYGRIESYTQTGATFTIDSASRFSKIKPVRRGAANDVTTWKNALDFNTSSGAAIVATDNLDVLMRGSPKLGTITAIEVRVESSGSWDYVVLKAGESSQTGSGSGSQAIDLSSWDFASDWDFENIEIQIDGTGAATINLITLDITFDEQETGSDLALPVFQVVTGYEDVATQYEDGAAIVSASQLLRNPIHIANVLMRDKRFGSRIEAAGIETSNIVAEVAKIADWYFDFSLEESMDIDGFSEFLKHGKIRMFRTFDNKWKFSVFDKENDAVAAFFGDTNIAVRNPGAPAAERESSFDLYQSPLNEVYNEFVLDYGWNAAFGTYTKQKVATHHYTITGTATMDTSAETLTDATKDFVALGVQVGHKVFVIRDKLYEITTVATTVLGVTPVDETEIVSSRSDTYYLGPNYDFNCHRSLLKYKEVRRLAVPSRFIYDDTTAQNLLDYLVDYYSQRQYMARFRTWLNAVDLEIGDLVILDHEDLPLKKRPTTLGTIATTAATKAATSITMAGTGAQLTRAEDRIIVKPAGSKLYRECLECSSTSSPNIVVTRAYAGTVARPWPIGSVVQRVVLKWEVVEMRILQDTDEIEVVVREAPRDYNPVGHAAPAGTADWPSASTEDRHLYGFCCYPNSELSWLDPESQVSFARDP